MGATRSRRKGRRSAVEIKRVGSEAIAAIRWWGVYDGVETKWRHLRVRVHSLNLARGTQSPVRSPEPTLNLFAALFADLPLDEIVYAAWVGAVSLGRDLEIVSVPICDVFKEDEAESKALAFI